MNWYGRTDEKYLPYHSRIEPHISLLFEVCFTKLHCTVDTKLQLKLPIKIQKDIIWFHLTVNTAYFIISPETRQVKTFPKRKREFSWYSEFVNILVIYLQYEMQCQHLLLYSFLILFEHLQIWNNFKKNSVCDYRFIGIWKLYFERIY